MIYNLPESLLSDQEFIRQEKLWCAKIESSSCKFQHIVKAPGVGLPWSKGRSCIEGYHLFEMICALDGLEALFLTREYDFLGLAPLLLPHVSYNAACNRGNSEYAEWPQAQLVWGANFEEPRRA